MTTLAPPPRRPAARPAPRQAARPASRHPRTFRKGDHVRRLRLWQLGLLVLVTIVAGRVVDLQVIQGPTLAAAAEKSRTREVVIPAVRGDITDVNGVPLATTVAARNVTADQTLVEDVDATAAALASVLGGDAAAFAPRLQGTRRFVYLAKNVTPEMWAKVAALKLPGIFSEATSTRVYPAGEVAANVVGHVRADGTGGSGLEWGLDDQLAGVAGATTYESSARGHRDPHRRGGGHRGRAREDGEAHDRPRHPMGGAGRHRRAGRLRQGRQRHRRRDGPAHGQDPGARDRSHLRPEPSCRGRGRRHRQPRCLRRVRAGIDQQGDDDGCRHRGGQPRRRPPRWSSLRSSSVRAKTWHDHSPHGTLKLTLNGVLAKSSNIGTIMAAEKIGGDTLYSYLKKFGIGEKTGLDFPGESKGYVPAPAQWSDTTFGTLAFGQGLSVNAVQAASVYATIANNGVRVTPSLVDGYTLPDGTYEPAPAPSKTRVVSTKTATTVRAMLESVVSADGTAPNAAIAGYRVAGKTGTANRIDDDCHCYRGYTASFIGIAPADKPEPRRRRLPPEPAQRPLRRRPRRPRVQARHLLRAPAGAHAADRFAAPADPGRVVRRGIGSRRARRTSTEHAAASSRGGRADGGGRRPCRRRSPRHRSHPRLARGAAR